MALRVRRLAQAAGQARGLLRALAAASRRAVLAVRRNQVSRLVREVRHPLLARNLANRRLLAAQVAQQAVCRLSRSRHIAHQVGQH